MECIGYGDRLRGNLSTKEYKKWYMTYSGGQADGLRKGGCCWCEVSGQEYAWDLTGKRMCETRTTLKELLVLLPFLFFLLNGTKNLGPALHLPLLVPLSFGRNMLQSSINTNKASWCGYSICIQTFLTFWALTMEGAGDPSIDLVSSHSPATQGGDQWKVTTNPWCSAEGTTKA